MSTFYNETEIVEEISNSAFYHANLGPFCAGLLIQILTMGFLSVQIANYFDNYENDNRWNKILVSVLLMTGVFQTATNFQLLYDAFVFGYGRIGYWNKFGWTFIYQPTLVALIAALCQTFFLHRCFVVTKSKFILSIGIMLISVSFGAGLATSIKLVEVKYYTRIDIILIESTTWLISTAVTDLGIAVILIQKLRAVRTSFLTTVRLHILLREFAPYMICLALFIGKRKMAQLSFRGAALTSAIAALNLILYAGFWRQNSIRFFFQFTIGNLYSHTVMITLLARPNSEEASGIHFIQTGVEPEEDADPEKQTPILTIPHTPTSPHPHSPLLRSPHPYSSPPHSPTTPSTFEVRTFITSTSVTKVATASPRPSSSSRPLSGLPISILDLGSITENDDDDSRSRISSIGVDNFIIMETPRTSTSAASSRCSVVRTGTFDEGSRAAWAELGRVD